MANLVQIFRVYQLLLKSLEVVLLQPFVLEITRTDEATAFVGKIENLGVVRKLANLIGPRGSFGLSDICSSAGAAGHRDGLDAFELVDAAHCCGRILDELPWTGIGA